MSETVAVTLPSMGESVAEGTVARWVKAVGDEVKEGDTVAEVTTDKVDVEVPAPASGRIEEIVAGEGETVEVGAVLARISSGAAAAGNGAPPAPAGTRQATSAATPASEQTPPGAAETTATTDTATFPAPPPARRRAEFTAAPRESTDATAPVVAAAPRADGTTELRGPAAALVEYMERSR
ncbi:MAG: biotin/lipoyl-containing protein, partial [Candidatus Dormibacteria bacterium]